MKHTHALLSTALSLTLAACGPAAVHPQPAANAPGGTQILGLVKVEFSRVGTPDFRVNATVLGDTLSAQALARTGGVTFSQGTRSSFTGPDGTRYLSGTLNVSNAGAPRSNVTLIGVSMNLGLGHTLGDTSLAAATRADGASLTPAEARSVFPLNRRTLVEDAVQVAPAQADFQALRESDLTPAINTYLAASPYNGYAFPFGFVARSKVGTRALPVGTGVGSVTLSFRAPDVDPGSSADDLANFTWYGLITADSENRVTADAFKPNTGRACAAASSLYDTAATNTTPVSVVTLRNVLPTSCALPGKTSQPVETVRIAGPAAAPTSIVPPLAP